MWIIRHINPFLLRIQNKIFNSNISAQLTDGVDILLNFFTLRSQNTIQPWPSSAAS